MAFEYFTNFSDVLDSGRCMIFTGRTGTGKNHLACAIANGLLNQGHTVVIITVRDLISKVKATWSKNAEQTELQVMQLFVGVDLLVLDEIGVQFDSEAERLIMYDVINGRYAEMKPTIVISNFPVDSPDGGPSIRKVIGDRCLDRLRESGGKQVIFDWDSYRAGAA